MLKLNNQYYEYKDSDTFISLMLNNITSADVVKNKQGVSYIDIPCAFDIETSSFYENDEKRACCYLWQFGFNGSVIIGRNLIDEFNNFIFVLAQSLNLSENLRLICYVHNLAYEFQWLCNLPNINFSFDNFNFMANKIRQPFKAFTTLGVEFRCSYILSGYSLAKVAENLVGYKLSKLDLDYKPIRHSKTELTQAEIKYAINDVLIVMAYIDNQIDIYDSIINVPLTNTQRVRKYVSKKMLFADKQIARRCHFDSKSYTMYKLAFAGGFTHANKFNVGRKLKNIGSVDFTSSYPYVMLSEKFPMSTPQLHIIHNEQDFKNCLKFFACVFEITFYDIYAIENDSFISGYHCTNLIKPVYDNGRIFRAEKLTTVITELDFEIIKSTYSYSSYEIGEFYIAKKDYLPLSFVQAILKLYQDKTQLKGVSDKEIEYQLSKGMLNSCYGMTVTDIIKENFSYDKENKNWCTDIETIDIFQKIEEYNFSKSRFLFYGWGVYVTAYARRNLIKNILKLGNDYVYSDTDSIKFLNPDKNKHIFDEYNLVVTEKLKQVAMERNIDFELFRPATIKGVKKLIGVFDFEGVYKYFKTLGAKRYIYTDTENKLHITIAGVNKYTGVDALKSYEDFDFGFTFTAEYCGKSAHTYIDNEISGVVTDYKGVCSEYHELSAIHLENVEFTILDNAEYIELVKSCFKGEIVIDN